MPHTHSATCYHGGRHRRPLAERFWPRVIKGPGCWEWAGGHDSNGYGIISRGAPEYGSMRASHAAWMLAYGERPAGFVLHHCDNPNCVRIDHLFVGDKHDNAVDMRAKGRGYDASGERNGRAKLSRPDVDAIRRVYGAGGTTQAKLAQAFGVSPALISFIVTGKNWR